MNTPNEHHNPLYLTPKHPNPTTLEQLVQHWDEHNPDGSVVNGDVGRGERIPDSELPEQPEKKGHPHRTMSDTPRTDEILMMSGDTSRSNAIHALERELNAMRRERDEAKLEVERLSGTMSWSEAKAHEDAAELRVKLAGVESDNARLREELESANKLSEWSRRDRFAAAFLQGIGAYYSDMETALPDDDSLAKWSFKVADAMLTASKEAKL